MPDTTPRNPIDIRSARLEDAVHVAKLGAHVFASTFGHSLPVRDLEAYLHESYSVEAVTKDLHDADKDMVVATSRDGTIVAFALLTRGTSEPCISQYESTVELQRIYVQLAYHGLGIGRMLAQTLEAMASAQGFKHIWLGVWEENYKAQKVYERLGYGMVGEHDFIMGEVVQTDIIMVKRL